MNIAAAYRTCLLLVLLLVLTDLLHAQIPDSLFPKQPDPPRLVNDYTATLSTAETKWLEDKLVEFDRSTSNQLSIVLVKTIAGFDIADYATALGRRWGIGQKEKNNGVLIVVAMQSHDINITPGFGLEGDLPDLLCKQIIEHEMVPSFRQGYYYDGLDKATSVIISATQGAFKAEGSYASGRNGMPRWLIILLLIVGVNGFLLIVIPLLRKLFYFLIGKKPPKRRQGEWTYSTRDVTTNKEEPVSNTSGSSDGFAGYGGGSFGGAGASGKW
jgi:uncharacterized protein